MSSRKHPRVVLTAESAEGAIVEAKEIGFDAYYDGNEPLVDSNEYRASRRIRRLKGEIYGERGLLQQSFDNRYAANGRYLGGRTVHSDGTVIED